MPSRIARVGLALLLALLLTPAVLLAGAGQPALAQGTGGESTGGYYYVVQRGDTWSGIAWRTGIPVADLKAANPAAIHPRDWLWVGDRLFIPAHPSNAPEEATAGGYWYQVRAGETWQSISQATGASLQELWAANPTAIRANRWLYVGQWVWIPVAVGGPAPTPSATAIPSTAASQATPTVTAVPLPTATITPTVAVTATAVITATKVAPVPTATLVVTATRPSAAITTTATVTTTKPAAAATPTPTKAAASGTAQPTRPAGCPAAMADYADAIASHLNRSGNTATSLATWLATCGAISKDQGTVTQVPIQSSTSKDVVVVLRDPAGDGATSVAVNPKGMLLVYHAGANGYALALKADGTGTLTLLQAKDLNADGKPDLVWTDTSCGAHTCFDTLFIRSWNGTGYQSWITGEPTMAYPEYSFKDTVAGGSGQEILIYGGVIGSAGAGPQRAWTETYISPEGAPYRLYSQVYDASDCLYHHVLDANQAFSEWSAKGFDPAITAYQAALDNQKLKACGTVSDELAKLRDFMRFRLVVSYVAGGQAGQVGTIKAQIGSTTLLGAANMFLDSYKGSGSIVQACRDTTTYAAANPGAWDFLADWGYANPGFTAQDLCPLGQ